MNVNKEKELDKDNECDEVEPKKCKISEQTASTSQFFNEATKENLSLKSPLSKKESMGMDEMLTCGICKDIMYHCSSIQPCMHTFCGACLIVWIDSGEVCPMCRGQIDGILKNHLLAEIINKYIEHHPDKEKSIDERQEADLKILNKQNKLFFTNHPKSSSNDLVQLPLNDCLYCSYPSYQVPVFNAVDLSQTPLSNYHCEPSTNHTQCQCCNIYMPLLDDTESYPKQKCHICNRILCSLVLRKCRNCLHGCLHIFKEFVFNPNLNSLDQVPQFLPDNFYETNVLRNYLNARDITVVDMFKECLSKMYQGEFHLDYRISQSDALCQHCSKQLIVDLVFEYCQNIPKERLPPSVTSRPDCHYGRYCRTQRTRQHHAVSYNHVCPQTRF